MAIRRKVWRARNMRVESQQEGKEEARDDNITQT
jgi:hypothetical protein